jgi:hypothetical protein
VSPQCSLAFCDVIDSFLIVAFYAPATDPQDISEPQWNQDEYLILHAGSPHVTDSDPLTQVERWLAAEVLPHDVPCGDPLIQPTSYTESFPLSSLSSCESSIHSSFWDQRWDIIDTILIVALQMKQTINEIFPIQLTTPRAPALKRSHPRAFLPH